MTRMYCNIDPVICGTEDLRKWSHQISREGGWTGLPVFYHAGFLGLGSDRTSDISLTFCDL